MTDLAIAYSLYFARNVSAIICDRMLRNNVGSLMPKIGKAKERKGKGKRRKGKKENERENSKA